MTVSGARTPGNRRKSPFSPLFPRSGEKGRFWGSDPRNGDSRGSGPQIWDFAPNSPEFEEKCPKTSLFGPFFGEKRSPNRSRFWCRNSAGSLVYAGSPELRELLFSPSFGPQNQRKSSPASSDSRNHGFALNSGGFHPDSPLFDASKTPFPSPHSGMAGLSSVWTSQTVERAIRGKPGRKRRKC